MKTTDEMTNEERSLYWRQQYINALVTEGYDRQILDTLNKSEIFLLSEAFTRASGRSFYHKDKPRTLYLDYLPQIENLAAKNLVTYIVDEERERIEFKISRVN